MINLMTGVITVAYGREVIVPPVAMDMVELIVKHLMQTTIYVTIMVIGIARQVNAHAKPVIVVMIAKPKIDCFLV